MLCILQTSHTLTGSQYKFRPTTPFRSHIPSRVSGISLHQTAPGQPLPRPLYLIQSSRLPRYAYIYLQMHQLHPKITEDPVRVRHHRPVRLASNGIGLPFIGASCLSPHMWKTSWEFAATILSHPFAQLHQASTSRRLHTALSSSRT